MHWVSLLKLLLANTDAKTASAIILAGGFLWFQTTQLVEAKHAEGVKAIESNKVQIQDMSKKTEQQLIVLASMQATMQKLEQTLEKVDERLYEVYRQNRREIRRARDNRNRR